MTGGRVVWDSPDGAARARARRAGVSAVSPEAVIRARGWRRRAIAFLAGATGALALPPFGLFPAMAAALTVAVWLIDGSGNAGEGRAARLKSAFGAGWMFGFGYFVSGLWWVGAACLVDGVQYLWALPLGVLALPAGLALFPGVGFALASLVWSSGALRIFALAFGLGASEWARGLLFTGFPWNDVGMTLGANLVLAQVASAIGLHGLAFVAIALFAAPATLWRPGHGPASPLPAAAAVVALVVIAAFGVLRLAAPASETVAGVRLRLMQPNVSQGADFAPERKDAIMRRYLELSGGDGGQDGGGAGFTHLIWPESAFPFILSREPEALGDIASLLRPDAVLITGAATMDPSVGGKRVYHNSIEVVGRDGLLDDRYDKRHLVPFGEYLPFQSLFDAIGLTAFVQAPGGFTAGAAGRTFSVPGLPPFMPLICYEAIFPVEIGDVLSGAARPDWLLNLTDDAWFGTTPGPWQHYAQARLRAIELGLPLARVANSGVSGVVDGLGREIAATPLGVERVLDAPLPKPLRPTWQSRFGSATAAAIGLAALALAALGAKRAG